MTGEFSPFSGAEKDAVSSRKPPFFWTERLRRFVFDALRHTVTAFLQIPLHGYDMRFLARKLAFFTAVTVLLSAVDFDQVYVRLLSTLYVPFEIESMSIQIGQRRSELNRIDLSPSELIPNRFNPDKCYERITRLPRIRQ